MITDSNIKAAREASQKAQSDFNKVSIDYDAYKGYVAEIVAGKWEQGGPVPAEGPLTKKQAELIDVLISQDYTMPIVFMNPEVQTRADALLGNLKNSFELYKKVAEEKNETLKQMEEQYTADLERADQIAQNDPSVIAAKENVDAAKIKAQSDEDKRREKAESDRQTRNMIGYGILGLFMLSVFVIVMSKIIKG